MKRTELVETLEKWEKTGEDSIDKAPLFNREFYNKFRNIDVLVAEAFYKDDPNSHTQVATNVLKKLSDDEFNDLQMLTGGNIVAYLVGRSRNHHAGQQAAMMANLASKLKGLLDG